MAKYCRAALFVPAEAGGFVVTCPAFPGLVTAGDTMEEARTMLTLKAGGKCTCRFLPTDYRSKSRSAFCCPRGQEPATPVTEE